jgi:hypothetical protein
MSKHSKPSPTPESPADQKLLNARDIADMACPGINNHSKHPQR